MKRKTRNLTKIVTRIEKTITENHKSYTKMFSEATQERQQILKHVSGSGWTPSNLHSPELATNFLSPEETLKEFIPCYFVFEPAHTCESALKLWWFGNAIKKVPPLYQTEYKRYRKSEQRMLVNTRVLKSLLSYQCFKFVLLLVL